LHGNFAQYFTLKNDLSALEWKLTRLGNNCPTPAKFSATWGNNCLMLEDDLQMRENLHSSFRNHFTTLENNFPRLQNLHPMRRNDCAMGEKV